MKNTEDLENEIWKKHPIGIMVSNMGRVWTRIKGKHYGSKDSTPYLKVKLKGKKYQVHRLICEAFHQNEDNLPCVNHIDENKQNNRADNLEWCTYEYNANYGTAIERRVKNTDYKAFQTRKVAHTDYKAIGEKQSIPILQLNKNMEVIQEWKSAMEAQREGGFRNGNINNCLKGRSKSHKGYIWRYAEGVRKAIS